VLAKLRDVGLVDDAAFARYWIDNRAQFRPRGARALRQELHRKGVERDVIAAALAEQAHTDEAAARQAALAKADRYRRLPWPQFAQKLSAFLLRQGFDYETARAATQAAWQTLHAEGRDTVEFDTFEE
jgi:regulatory protein